MAVAGFQHGTHCSPHEVFRKRRDTRVLGIHVALIPLSIHWSRSSWNEEVFTTLVTDESHYRLYHHCIFIWK